MLIRWGVITVFSEPAFEHVEERGASKAEGWEVMRHVESLEVRQGRIGFRLNVPFREEWNDT